MSVCGSVCVWVYVSYQKFNIKTNLLAVLFYWYSECHPCAILTQCALIVTACAQFFFCSTLFVFVHFTVLYCDVFWFVLLVFVAPFFIVCVCVCARAVSSSSGEFMCVYALFYKKPESFQYTQRICLCMSHTFELVGGGQAKAHLF